MSNATNALLKVIWGVIQENEGLVIATFEKEADALEHAKALREKQPFLRVDVARYSIELDSLRVHTANDPKFEKR